MFTRLRTFLTTWTRRPRLRLADELRQDLRYAVRGLSRRPGFGLTATLTLGLGLGAALGFGAALPISELIRPLLFGVAPRAAGTLAGLTALLVAVCAAASLLAAWRATRIDPLAAFRESE